MMQSQSAARKRIDTDAAAESQNHPDTATLLFGANISLNGAITENTLAFFLDQLKSVRDSGNDLILEINTIGGDAEVGRRIALEIRNFRAHSGRQAWCVGKTNIYSAGVTIMAAFPVHCRFLTADAVLLVHERRLDQSIDIDGPIQSCIQIVRETLAMLETAHDMEMEGFRELVEGSRMSVDDLVKQAETGCYMRAQEAHRLGLIAAILE